MPRQSYPSSNQERLQSPHSVASSPYSAREGIEEAKLARERDMDEIREIFRKNVKDEEQKAAVEKEIEV